uniref:GMP synthase n=1 Tax=Thermosporothrix sp. COM3 TaxID=2490863 RepID=A0A455SM30_9CHLR|nr:GMP synthase [Thermosporothrix sp. COM3]
MAKQILVLQHAQEDPIGFLGEILEEYGVSFEPVLVETETLPAPTAYAAVIALGGTQHVYDRERHPYFATEAPFLRHLVEQDIPYLGICLGSQLLADALGGHVRRHHTAEIGFYDVELTPEGRVDPLFAGFTDACTVFHWHEDVFELPAGAVLLATSPAARNQAFRIGKRAYGLQFHIEITPEMLQLWLQAPVQRPRSAQEIALLERLQREQRERFPIFHRHSRILFKNFLKSSNLLQE